MARKKRSCPVCSKTTCVVAEDGKSGFCKTKKSRWQKKMVPVGELQPGPVRHELDPFLVDIARWDYKIVGRYIHSTLEEWELGFMRDANPEQEVALWHRIAFAFITYHTRNGLPLRSDEEEKKLLGQFVSLTTGGKAASDIEQCLEEPDGWKEEVEKLGEIGESGSGEWTPPEGLEKWPNV